MGTTKWIGLVGVVMLGCGETNVEIIGAGGTGGLGETGGYGGGDTQGGTESGGRGGSGGSGGSSYGPRTFYNRGGYGNGWKK